MTEPLSELAQANIEKAIAEAAKFRAEEHELLRPAIKRPGFWAAMLPALAVVLTALYAAYAGVFEVEAKRAENKLLAANTALEQTKAAQTLLAAEKIMLEYDLKVQTDALNANHATRTTTLDAAFAARSAALEDNFSKLEQSIEADQIALNAEKTEQAKTRKSLELAREDIATEVAGLNKQRAEIEVTRKELAGLLRERDDLQSAVNKLNEDAVLAPLRTTLRQMVTEGNIYASRDSLVALLNPEETRPLFAAAIVEFLNGLNDPGLRMIIAGITLQFHKSDALEQFYWSDAPHAFDLTQEWEYSSILSDQLPDETPAEATARCMAMEKLLRKPSKDFYYIATILHFSNCLFDDPKVEYNRDHVVAIAELSLKIPIFDEVGEQIRRSYIWPLLINLNPKASDLWLAGALSSAKFSAEWHDTIKNYASSYKDVWGANHPLGTDMAKWRTFWTKNKDRANIPDIVALLREYPD